MMNDPAERLFTIPCAPAPRAALGAGQRRALLVVHRRHARERRPAPRRRIGMTDREPAMRCRSGDRRQDSVGARRVDRRRHDPARPARGDREVEAVRQLKQASDELERKIQAATADIAQQNELLRRRAIELEQASALKSQFLANMSHEFRTPLNAMLGIRRCCSGAGGPLSQPVKRQLSRVESNGRHLLTIISRFSTLAHRSGRMPPRSRPSRCPNWWRKSSPSSSRSSCARSSR